MIGGCATRARAPAPHLQLLRIHHDPQWKLLPVRELREYERVQLGGLKADCSDFRNKIEFW